MEQKPGLKRILENLQELQNSYHNTACRLNDITGYLTGEPNKSFAEYLQGEKVGEPRQPGLINDLSEQIVQLRNIRGLTEMMLEQLEVAMS